MTWVTPNTPNLADYTTFVQNSMGISPTYLPTNSPWLSYALNQALNLVINVPTSLPGADYTLAVYNCAGHIQLKITPDAVVSGISYNFFANKRAEFGLL